MTIASPPDKPPTLDNSKIIIAIQKKYDQQKTGKDLLYPIAFYSGQKYHEITVGGAQNEKEVAKNNLKFLSILNQANRYEVISDGKIKGKFILENVRFRDGLGCENAFIPVGKINFNAKESQKTLNEHNTLFLSAIGTSLTKEFHELIRNIPLGIRNKTKELAERDFIENTKRTALSNMNLSSLRIEYVQAYDINADVNIDLIILQSAMKLYKSIDSGEADELTSFMIVSVDGSSFRKLYFKEPSYYHPSLVGIALPPISWTQS